MAAVLQDFRHALRTLTRSAVLTRVMASLLFGVNARRT